VITKNSHIYIEQIWIYIGDFNVAILQKWMIMTPLTFLLVFFLRAMVRTQWTSSDPNRHNIWLSKYDVQIQSCIEVTWHMDGDYPRQDGELPICHWGQSVCDSTARYSTRHTRDYIEDCIGDQRFFCSPHNVWATEETLISNTIASMSFWLEIYSQFYRIISNYYSVWRWRL
jgi:hypothetical protein